MKLLILMTGGAIDGVHEGLTPFARVDAIGGTVHATLTIPEGSGSLKSGIVLGNPGGTLTFAGGDIQLNASASTGGDIRFAGGVTLNLNDGAFAVSAGDSLVFAADGVIGDETGVINLRGILSLEAASPFVSGTNIIELRPVASSAVVSVKNRAITIPARIALTPTTDFTVNLECSGRRGCYFNWVRCCQSRCQGDDCNNPGRGGWSMITTSGGIVLGEGSELRIDGGGEERVSIDQVTFSEDGGIIAVNANTLIATLLNDRG